ncbi:hypothetical protein M407DRAFT_20420 [Tulasnella calospora MUT 4182]|uniref:UvrD-like helicase ATP-binding domain-containing protein n=1 Tax=Tulasnella calospora MUT 4182 TaxID=1051891 RepID=A0A0C3MA06_9AGAM|nr:hypothetical protein M407DRAFT_20420 [Tulasnella calospora MUT 4182]
MDINAALDYHVFSRPIRSLRDLENAFLELSRAVDTTRYPMEDILTELLDHPHYLFEALLVSDGLGGTIRSYLTTPWSKTQSSLPQPHFGFIKSFQARLHRLKILVSLSPQVARISSTLEAVAAAIRVTRVIETSFQDVRKKGVKSNVKRSHKVEDLDSDSDAIFNRVDCTSPKSKEEARDLAEELSRRLCNMMKIYTGFLLERHISASVRNALIDGLQEAPEANASSSTAYEGLEASSSAFMSAPHDALTYLGDTVEEGKWLVVLAQRALKHMRQISTKHTVLYNVAIRKLEELKEGLFTRTNHAQFLDSKYRIPLYAAELINGVHIIYQIDCGAPSESSDLVSQFIRVFDIDEIKESFWRSVAAQFHGRDPEYCGRCNARSIPRCKVSGINVIPPLIFGRDSNGEFTEYSGGINAQSQNEESFLELHRILALEKFIPYSPELIHSVEKDTGGTFMFSMSASERDIIDHRSSCLVLGRSGTGKTTTMMFKMLAYEMSTRAAGFPCRQMFVTQSPALAEKVKAYYDKLKKSSLDLDSEDRAANSPVIEDFTLDDVRTRDRVNTAALPASWKELRDEDFPIFLSYDELCNLLAADSNIYYESEMPSTNPTGWKISDGTKQWKITFTRFMSRIWPYLGQRKLDVDPLLFFNEIMGVIKGSELSLSFESGCLDRTTYETLGTRAYPVFASQRTLVYDLFLGYLRFKPKSSWDAADRSHALICAVKKNLPTPLIDFIYVDEAQDNLLIDTFLLRALCPNPHGLFFAGDTAQTISAGSTFRFNDLKAFLYRLEHQDSRVVARKRKPVEPRFFSLSVNYRSHAGIIDAAAFLVSSLARWFPGSIDILAPEHALVRGPKPVFFLGRGAETPFENYISGTTSSEMEFGADQVIIVRDDSACQALRAKIGKRTGMVLLYDFFANSQAQPKDWRALLKATRSTQSTATGDMDRLHAILQTELKCLYVGMTRARERVWFWDSGYKGDAFESIMVENNLARAASTREAPLCMGRVQSSRREWALRGKECFRREDYFNASLAFERAGLAWWKSVADAFERKRVAEMLPARDLSRGRALKRSAGEIVVCADGARTSKDKTTLLEIGANCYLEAKDHERAASLFYRLERYNDAAWNYRVAGSFRKAISVIETHHEQMNTDLAQDIKDIGALVFVRRGSKELAKSIFSHTEDYLQFLDENGFHEQRILALIELSRHEEAAHALLRLDRRSEAIDQLLQAGGREHQRQATEYLLESIFLHLSFGSPPTNSSELGKLVRISSQFIFTPIQQAEIEVVRAIQPLDSRQLAFLGQRYSQSQLHVALLCLDTYLRVAAVHPLGKNPSDITCAIESLRLYVLFGRSIRRAAQLQDIAKHPDFQRIFGLAAHHSVSGSDRSQIPDGVVAIPNSVIYPRAARDLQHGRAIKLDSGILLPIDTASQYIRQALLSRYNSLATPLLDALERYRQRSPFTICLFTGCSKDSCERHHPDFSVGGFNQRTELHLLVVAALECLNTNPAEQREFYQQLWFQRLIETCYPLDARLGNISWLKPSIIPNYDTLISAAKIWCEDVYRNMDLRGAYFMTNATGCAMFGSALDRHNAGRYLTRGTWRHTFPRPAAYHLMASGLNWFLHGTLDRHLRGVAFIRRVVTEGRRMDAFTLTSFAEEVISHLIYSRLRLCSKEIILPQSWVIRACQHGTSQMTQDLGTVPAELVDTLSQLLEIFQTGDAGELHYRGRPVSEVHRVLKVSAIVRICQMLTLVGSNLGGSELKDSVLSAFQEAHKRESMPHPRYVPFLTATTWSELDQALDGLAQGLQEDPLLDLVDGFESRQRPRHYKTRGARLVQSMSDEELLAKLDASDFGIVAPLPAFPHALPADAAGSSESTSALSEIATQEPSSTESGDNHAGQWSTEEKLAARKIIACYRSYRRRAGGGLGDPLWSAYNSSDNQAGQWTTEEKLAAQKIIACYQRYRRRAEGGLGDPLWSAYNDRAENLVAVSRPSRRYRIYMRSVIPKLLAYLQGLIQRLNKANESLNEQASSVPHEELDDIRSKTKVVRKLMRDAKVLERTIAPQAPLHSALNPDSLKAEVSKVIALRKAAIESCPAVKELEVEYQESVELMMAERKPKISKLRPTLNVDDLYFGPGGVLA